MIPRLRLVALLAALTGPVLLTGQTREPQPSAGTQGPTFRAQVEYVEVDALVVDDRGNFVRGLEKDDFQVVEDGKPQTISTFSFVDIPIAAGRSQPDAAAAIEPDTQSNDRPFDGRIYVMVLDDLHIDPARTAQVRQAARQFVEQNLGANDLMAVTFTGRADASQEFTSNKRLLLNALELFRGVQLQGVTLNKNDQYRQQIDIPPGGGSAFVDDLNDAARSNNSQATLSTLRQVAGWLSGIRGRRKTLLLFSEGIDYDLTDVIRGPRERPSAAPAIVDQLRETLATAARSNVAIYGIDPRALNNVGDATVVGFANQNDRSTGIGLGSLRQEQLGSQGTLRQLSEQTGGFAAVNTNDLPGVFARIVRDNSSYYLLAYYPPVTEPDGKFHEIEVKVNRPGLTVRARRGYALPRTTPATRRTEATRTTGVPPQLSEAMASLLPVSGLTMRVFAAPFNSAKKNATVVVGIELNGRDVSTGSDGKVDIALMAVDQRSKVVGARRDSLNLDLPAEGRARVEQNGIRLLNRLELPPGRYRLRAAALDNQKKLVGSVVYDLEVPDFSRQPIALSGINVTSRAGAAMMTVIADDRLKETLPAPFVALRQFARNDELDFFTEIYDNSGKTPHKVDVVTAVSTSEGRQVFQNREEHESKEFKGATRALPHTARLSLSQLAPGDYVLSIEARSRLGDNPSAARQVPFRVLP